MNLKLKALVAAAVVAVSGQASAALSGDTQGNGSLFLTVWDVVTNESYVRDLGVSIDSFLPTSVTPSGALNSAAGVIVTGPTFNFGGSALFTGVFGNNTAANIRFTIVGVDNEEGTGNGSRVVATINGSPAASFVNGGVRGIANNTASFQGELIANLNNGLGDGSVTEATSTGLGSTEGGGAGWGSSIAGATPNNHAGEGFGSAQFWFAQTTTDDATNDSANANITRFGNGTNFSTFSLNSDGSVTYALAAAVAAVPVPAAAWLLGAGLLGLGSAARRRKAAALA